MSIAEPKPEYLEKLENQVDTQAKLIKRLKLILADHLLEWIGVENWTRPIEWHCILCGGWERNGHKDKCVLNDRESSNG